MNGEADKDDLLQAMGGDADAFLRAVTPYFPMLYAYARSITGDHHAAQDVVQQTSLIAWRKINLLFPEIDFGSWLKGIARREALSDQRKTRRLSSVVSEILETAFVDPGPDALGSEREALGECLKKLDAEAAELVRAHYFQGQKLVDIAQARNINGNTVRTLLHRARSALADCVRLRLGWGTT